MVDSITENIFLINAPAGSGKTTKIRSMVLNHMIEEPEDNILCITYTNRAAEELKYDLVSPKVYVSTIHSFLNDFIGMYFRHPEIISLFFEVYKDKIEYRIANVNNEEHITKSNEKYIEKYGLLNIETVKNNIKALSYNETSYNSLYYGGLSHDDLISFSKQVIDHFIVIKNRITQKFQVIFLDEYQDSSDDVLDVFYSSVINSSTKLYFLGDKMQQIYNNYNGTFEAQFSKLNTTISLNINHRSIPCIINILNSLYNDPVYKQEPSTKNQSILPDHEPRVIICSDVNEKLKSELDIYPKALCLYLLNQKKFDSLGAGNLFRSLNRLNRYSHIQKYSATNVLSDSSNENPDLVLRLLFVLAEMGDFYKSQNLGEILRTLQHNKNIFNYDIFKFTTHADKLRIGEILDSVLTNYTNLNNETTIKDIFDTLNFHSLIRQDFLEKISIDEEYSEVMSVKLSEFKAVTKFIKNPNISTQHGVKGESHDTVFFAAEDSTRTPIVHMYKFFSLWSKVEISLTTLEAFYYEYCDWIKDTNTGLGFKLSDITPELHTIHQEYLVSRVSSLIAHYSENQYFNILCKKEHEEYLLRPNKTRVIKCFKENTVYGILSAYRLFYVGCSRSRRNLTIFIDNGKILDFKDEIIEKLISTGFSIL